jgi:hypothetical protein
MIFNGGFMLPKMFPIPVPTSLGFVPWAQAAHDPLPLPESPIRYHSFEQSGSGLNGILESLTPQETTVIGIVLTAGVVWLILAAIAKAVKQPVTVTVVPFDAPLESFRQVSPYIGAAAQQLIPLGFETRLDFTVPELPHEGFFRLMSTSNDEHTALLYEIMFHPRNSERTGRAPHNFMEFQTVFDDGTKVNTKNCLKNSPLVPLPHVRESNHPDVQDAEPLFAIHRRRVERIGTTGGRRILPQRPEDFSGELSREWRDTMSYNSSLGLFTLDESGTQYHGRAVLMVRYFFPCLFKKKRRT